MRTETGALEALKRAQLDASWHSTCMYLSALPKQTLLTVPRVSSSSRPIRQPLRRTTNEEVGLIDAA
jgi:hypothetical protein